MCFVNRKTMETWCFFLTYRELKIFGQLLIKHRIINYSILIRNSKKSSINLITNFPYRNKMCGNYSEKNDQVIATYDNKFGFRYALSKDPSNFFYGRGIQSKLFPSKLPRNLDKCEIKIVTGLWPPNVIDVNRELYPGIEVRPYQKAIFLLFISDYL